MNLPTLFILISVFGVLYKGVGLLLDMHKKTVSFGEKRSSNPFHGVKDVITSVGASNVNQALLKIGGLRRRLDDLLMRSGYPFGWKAGDFLFVKELIVLIGCVAVWQLDSSNTMAWIGAIVMGFVLPDILLRMRAGERRSMIQRALPGLVDLLALAIESGLDLVVALERISERMAPGALRQELQVLLQESRLGASRKEILQRWSHRTGVADAQSLSSLIIQSEEMGTPLANVLRNYAEDMRNRRVLRAEEIAGKIPVKILFPMMVFFFPIVFVIILGPMAVEFLKNSK